MVGIEVRSLKHHRIPPLNRSSVQRELSFSRKRTQNVDLPDRVGPVKIQVNGCFNLTSALIALVEMMLSPSNRLTYIERVRTIIVSQTTLEKDTLQILSGFFHY